MITTTTDHIEGYRITEYLGVVFADARMTLTTLMFHKGGLLILKMRTLL